MEHLPFWPSYVIVSYMVAKILDRKGLHWLCIFQDAAESKDALSFRNRLDDDALAFGLDAGPAVRGEPRLLANFDGDVHLVFGRNSSVFHSASHCILLQTFCQ